MKRSSPEPGTYRTRLVKGGPYVAVLYARRACKDGYEILCWVDGKPADALLTWDFCESISEREYRYLDEAAEWDRKFAPDSPGANPRRAIDIEKMEPVF